MPSSIVLEILCADIEVAGNIRQVRDAEKVQAIALSAREQGFKAPITVERGETKPYRLIDGWHRLGACELLGLTTVSALVLETPLTDAERIEHQLVLNALRTDLTPIEKAQAFQRLVELSGEPKGKLAVRIGINASAATRSLSLLTLSNELQTAIHAGLVGADTGYKLSRIKDPVKRRALSNERSPGYSSGMKCPSPNRDQDLSLQEASTARKPIESHSRYQTVVFTLSRAPT